MFLLNTIMLSFSSYHDILWEKFDTVSEFLLDPGHKDKDWEQVVMDFKNSGGRILGRGYFGKVFDHPSWPYVLKVFPRDDCYLKFVRFARENPMRGFPFFYDKPRRVLPTFLRGLDMANPYVVRMERLIPVPDGFAVAGRIVDMINEAVGHFGKGYDYRNYGAADHMLLFRTGEYYEPVKAGLLLASSPPVRRTGCWIDLHGENILMRKNGTDIVLSDPVAKIRITGASTRNFGGSSLSDLENDPRRVKPGKRHSKTPNRYKRKRMENKERRLTASL